jgi:hypothetical protein
LFIQPWKFDVNDILLFQIFIIILITKKKIVMSFSMNVSEIILSISEGVLAWSLTFLIPEDSEDIEKIVWNLFDSVLRRRRERWDFFDFYINVPANLENNQKNSKHQLYPNTIRKTLRNSHVSNFEFPISSAHKNLHKVNVISAICSTKTLNRCFLK